MLCNLLITWLLTGFWHGASWNYLLWGLYFFLLLTAEKLFLGRWLERLPRALQHVYALFFIVIGWLIFVFEDSAAGWSYLTTMLGAGGGFVSGTDVYELLRNAVFLVISVLACLPAPKRYFYRALEHRPRVTAAASAALSLVTLILCVAYLVNSSYNPFLYFRF
jgi:alginate O-acetyltransferase complex protein AlgI